MPAPLRAPTCVAVGRVLSMAIACALVACVDGERSDPDASSRPEGWVPEPVGSVPAQTATDAPVEPGGAPRAGAVTGDLPDGARAYRPDLRSIGLYVRPGGEARGALFTECGTDRVLAVEPTPASAALERAYLLERSGPGEPIRAEVAGRVGEAGTLRVDSVLTVGREAACPEDVVDRPLSGTRWRLSGLPESDDRVRLAGAWLLLDRETGAMRGSTGCRAVSAHFEWRGTLLRFGGAELGAGACRDGEGEAARAHAGFLEALRAVGSYRVRGSELELLGEEGVVARFDALPGG